MKPPSNPHLPATLEMIQVFEAVRNEHHEIIDFISVVTNQGERLSESNSVFVAEGIFDAFKQVVETGIPSKTERHYIHEQFDGWFILSIVKLNDGVVAATIDITKEKQYKPEINELRESNKERLRTIKEVYQSILSRERLEDSLVLLTELVTRETSGGARVIYHINNEDGTGDSKDIGGLPDHETPRAGDLSIPIKSREDKLLGTVTMYFREGHDATDEELVLADIVATTAAAILTSHTDNVKRAEAERLLKEANS